MKYFKLFLLVAAVAFFGSCSDDDNKWNTNAGVTVEMQDPTYSVKENAGTVQVPIKVTGKTNGKVLVTLAVKETGANPAKEDINYYVTSKTVIVADTAGYVEFEPVDDKEINDDRTFEFDIVDVKGATVGANSSCIVTILDNDKEPYDRVQGTWIMTGESQFQGGGTEKWTVTISGPKPGDENYELENGKVLYMTGLGGYPKSKARMFFKYNKTTKSGYLVFDQLGSWTLCENVYSNLGNHYITLGGLPTSNSEDLSTTSMTFTWDADYQTLTSNDPTLGLAGAIYTKADDVLQGYMFAVDNVNMTRSK